MAFIGIITDSKYEMQLKKALSNCLNSAQKEHTVIAINDKSIENIKNIRFETILVMDLERVINEVEAIRRVIQKF